MALIVKDRVRDTTTTTGTGAITLSGTAPLRYRNFASVCATSDTFPYAIVHQSVGVDEWEVGVGTLTATTTFARTTVIAGTNGTSAVVFSAGTKDVMLVYYGTPLALRTITGTAGQIAVTAGDGIAGNPTIAFDPGIVGPTTQSLTSGTGATYTTPANTKWIEVFMIGGGGGGAGGNSAGGLVAGSNGGTSTFNAINAAGGSGATAPGESHMAPGGAGGTGGTGTATRRQPGAPGGNSNYDGTRAASGAGGSGYFGGGALSNVGAAPTIVGNSAAANTGAGGSGGLNTAGPGFGGGGGSGEFVYLIINTPAGTYTYTVGTSGAGGVSTTNGGAGGTGFIFVIEHYDF